jgi:hypothetical protein
MDSESSFFQCCKWHRVLAIPFRRVNRPSTSNSSSLQSNTKPSHQRYQSQFHCAAVTLSPWSGLIISNCGIHPYCVMLKLIPCGLPLLCHIKIHSLGSTLAGVLITICRGVMLKFLKPTAKNSFQRRTPTYIYYSHQCYQSQSHCAAPS